MTDKKRRILLVLILAACVAGCILSICIKQRIEIQKATTKLDCIQETHFDWIYEIYEGKNGAAAVITKNNDIKSLWYLLEDWYIAGGKADYTDVMIYGKTDHLDLHTCELYLYDINEKRIVKTIDYKTILEKLPDDYYQCDYEFVKANGKYWVDIDISNYWDDQFLTQTYYEPTAPYGTNCFWWEGQYWKHVYVDLETEAAYLVSIGEKISIYDIYEERTVKTIDYKNILEEHVPGYYYYSSWNISGFNGKYYLKLRVLNSGADENGFLDPEYDEKYVWIDLEEEEVCCVLDDDSYPADFSEINERGREWKNEIDDEEDTITNFLEEKGFSYEYAGALEEREYRCNRMVQKLWSYDDGTYVISVLWSSLSKDNEMLDEYFPGLKDYEAKEDDRVTFFIAGYPDKEEIMEFLQILQ